MSSTKLTPRASRPIAPGYGIVADGEGEGLLPWSWAEERLTIAHNYFISTVRPDGRPHVMVIWGLWHDGAFWFSTGRASRKGRNLAGNPHCVITPEDGEEAVILEGIATELPEGTTPPAFAAAYQEKYGVDLSGHTEPLFTVKPTVVFGLIEKTFTTSATRWLFEG